MSETGNRTEADYGAFMSRKQRAEFERMRGDANLEGEIRLLRQMIGRLSPEYEDNHLAIARLVNALCRVVTLQMNRKGSDREVRDALERAGEMVLRLIELKDGNAGPTEGEEDDDDGR